MPTITPFSKVYTAIWDLLEADPNFTNLFQLGNRIRFDNENERDPLKQNIATADLPEILLMVTGGPINLGNTSNSTKVMQAYTLVINTGDLRINEYINALNWCILCNLARWRETLSALTWCSETYVKVVRIQQVTVGLSNQERNRGIHGFGSSWNIEIEMHFGNSSQLVFSEP